MSKVIISDEILGKDALDPEGGIVVVVVKVHIDEASMKITGITVDQGFMKPDVFVGSNYIKTFGVDTILLSKVPSTSYKGIQIITADGKIIGHVKDVVTEGAKVKELIGLSKNIAITKKKEFIVSNKQINEISSSVILNKGVVFKFS